MASPILLGVYEDGLLVESIKREGKISDLLPQLFQELLERFAIRRIYYARGPGSFMAIKLTYLFLRTLEITRGIELFGCDGFLFNGNRPIRATGQLYFLKEQGRIVTRRLERVPEATFSLPQRLHQLPCTKETQPLYVIPAV